VKKSEAINLLAGYLSTFTEYENLHPEELRLTASRILHVMETIVGMKPPGISIPTFAVFNNNVVEPIGNKTQVFIWEPES
jgi:hypothetical protein